MARLPIKEIIEILEDKNISRIAKKDQIASKVDIKKSEKAQMERIKCLCGMGSRCQSYV